MTVCGYALRKCASDNQQFSDEARQTVLSNFYADDLLKSVSDPQRSLALVVELRASWKRRLHPHKVYFQLGGADAATAELEESDGQPGPHR